MGVIAFLVVLAAIAGGIAFGVTVVSGMSKMNLGGNGELRNVKYQLKSARKTLYGIANGTAGNPQLEAQIVLEEMDRKELES